MGTFDDFWGKMGPGLLDLGAGLYNQRSGISENKKRLATAQGPLYQQAMGGAGNTLAEAGSFNPDTMAANRFATSEAMLKPVQDAQLADLQRMLYSKGMMGSAVYNPGVEGIVPNGTAMNPQLAAFYAAQNADRAKRAQASLLEGQGYANNLVSRANTLQGIAGNTQNTGITAQNTQGSPAAATGQMVKGITGMIGKNPGILKDVWNVGSGLFKNGLDWLGGGNSLAADFGGFASW